MKDGSLLVKIIWSAISHAFIDIQALTVIIFSVYLNLQERSNHHPLLHQLHSDILMTVPLHPLLLISKQFTILHLIHFIQVFGGWACIL